MRKIIITIIDDNADEPRTFEVRQVVHGGMVIENDHVACPCCIGKKYAILLEAATKSLGLPYLIWPDGWQPQWNRRGFASRWSQDFKNLLLGEINDTNGLDIEDTVNLFRKAEKLFLK